MMVFTPASTELVLAFFFPFDVILYIFLKNVICYMHTCQGILIFHFLKHLSFLAGILHTPLLVLYKLCPKTVSQPYVTGLLFQDPGSPVRQPILLFVKLCCAQHLSLFSLPLFFLPIFFSPHSLLRFS